MRHSTGDGKIRPMPRRTVSLFRRIERALETISSGSTPIETILETARYLAEHFVEDLGISGGRIYAQENGAYELVRTFGAVSKAPLGLTVPTSYAAFEELLDRGARVMDRDDPQLDQRLEADLGTKEHFAAISVAGGYYVLSFDVSNGNANHSKLLSTLNIVRLAVNQKLREERVLTLLEDARLIQESILPRRLPRLGDLQLAARSEPAEVVGGDFYDVISIDDSHLYLALADATGHGLPAALQVRDVYTGLRMGLSREFKITRTLERLNRIICRSRLSTRFVSLFLAELDMNGSLMFCNAGHPPALLVHSDGTIDRLSTGGTLLGPFPDTRYSIGLARLGPGELLLLYSDGITEARNADDQELGEEHLCRLVVDSRHRDPQAIVDGIFAAVGEHSGGGPREDDQTVLLVKRAVAGNETLDETTNE